MSMNLVTLLYLVASVFFIQALKGLSHPTTSRRGNAFGMVGMAIAIVTTVALILALSEHGAAGLGYVLAGLVVGGGAGTIFTRPSSGNATPCATGHAGGSGWKPNAMIATSASNSVSLPDTGSGR